MAYSMVDCLYGRCMVVRSSQSPKNHALAEFGIVPHRRDPFFFYERRLHLQLY